MGRISETGGMNSDLHLASSSYAVVGRLNDYSFFTIRLNIVIILVKKIRRAQTKSKSGADATSFPSLARDRSST